MKSKGDRSAGGAMHPGRRSRERMFASSLLTLEERRERQKKMWDAKTVEERSKLRDEHLKMLGERARKRKVNVDAFSSTAN